MALVMVSEKAVAGEYFEGFDARGKPPPRDGIHWGFTDEITPVAGWKEIIPGDGYAHLTVTAHALARHSDPSKPWPFQTLSLGPVGSNHRLSIRAANTAIPGLACLLFTYREKGPSAKVNEIDIEIAADDSQSTGTGHRREGPDGWTDARFNTWADAGEQAGKGSGRYLPSSTFLSPILDITGRKVSHRDGRFHTYTIEWRPESVRFFIDGVLQRMIEDIVPAPPSQVIMGMRRMPWAGIPEWTGTETMLIDWIDIEEL
jgi:hypothetical protein